jgi:hypothetical protein
MKRRLLLLAFTLVVAVGVGSSVALAGGGNSANAKLCQKNGWEALQTSSGGTLSSQGDCVVYAANGGPLFAPRLTATDSGCQVFEGFDVWTISATGFTPNSTGVVTFDGIVVPINYPIDGSGSATLLFASEEAGHTHSETFTDANGVSASVTYGPTTACPT